MIAQAVYLPEPQHKDFHMRPYGPVVLAAALAACASPPAASSSRAAEVAAPVVVTPIAPIVSDYEAMRSALPDFDLQRRADGPPTDISVVRDLVFDVNSSILSGPQVKRLVPLQAYLRAHPRTSVRIEGNGDGVNSPE